MGDTKDSEKIKNRTITEFIKETLEENQYDTKGSYIDNRKKVISRGMNLILDFEYSSYGGWNNQCRWTDTNRCKFCDVEYGKSTIDEEEENEEEEKEREKEEEKEKIELFETLFDIFDKSEAEKELTKLLFDLLNILKIKKEGLGDDPRDTDTKEKILDKAVNLVETFIKKNITYNRTREKDEVKEKRKKIIKKWIEEIWKREECFQGCSKNIKEETALTKKFRKDLGKFERDENIFVTSIEEEDLLEEITEFLERTKKCDSSKEIMVLEEESNLSKEEVIQNTRNIFLEELIYEIKKINLSIKKSIESDPLEVKIKWVKENYLFEEVTEKETVLYKYILKILGPDGNGRENISAAKSLMWEKVPIEDRVDLFNAAIEVINEGKWPIAEDMDVRLLLKLFAPFVYRLGEKVDLIKNKIVKAWDDLDNAEEESEGEKAAIRMRELIMLFEDEEVNNNLSKKQEMELDKVIEKMHLKMEG